MSATGPLAGIRVVDACQLAVGPLAAAWLGQLGADVVKVEAPSGDPIRRLEPWIGGVGTYYAAVNVNKRAISLDLKSEPDLAVMLNLCSTADVFIQNFRPGVIERLGLGFKRLSGLNPGLVYVSCSGYGGHGARMTEGGADPFIRMFTAFDTINGSEGQPAERYRNRGHIDHVTSAYLVQAALAGLHARSKTGRGQLIESSMMQAAIAYQASVFAEYLASGREPAPLGSKGRWGFPDQAFAASDGYIAVSALAQSQWRGLCAVLALPDDLKVPDSTPGERERMRSALEPAIAALLAEGKVEDWVERLTAAGVPASGYARLEDLRTETAASGGLVERVEHPWGVVQLAAPPWTFSRTPVSLLRAPMEDENGPELRAESQVPRDRSAAAAPDPNGPGLEIAPLADVRVVELASCSISASYAGMLLADLGAEVVKVVSSDGDGLRQLGAPSLERPGYGALYAELNHSKRLMTVNYASADDVAALRALIEQADVLLTDLPSARLAEHGLEPGGLRSFSPAMIVCQVTGYGSTDDLASRPASEITVQALAGTWRYLGATGGLPLRLGADAAATAGGIVAVQAVEAALLERNSSGEGQYVAVSELGAMLALEGHLIAALTEPGLTGGWHLTAPDMAIEYPLQAADGPIDYSFPDDFSFREFYRVVGIPDEIIDNPRFTDKFDIVVHWDEYVEAIGPYIKRIPSADVIELVQTFGGIAVHGNTYETLLRDQQLADMNMLIRSADEENPGALVSLSPPWNFGSSVLPARQPVQSTPQKISEVKWPEPQSAESARQI
jgi:CoA:oxalate CoA-transferase